MNYFNRSPFAPRVHNGYRIENKSDESTVYIYDEISWWGVSADQFAKDLNAITAGTIHLRINSPGGSVFDGTAIYNALKQHTAKVVVHIDGLAASIASVIALAGDEVLMGDGSYFMIHAPWSIAMGTADDMRKEAGLLDKVGGTISQIYQDRTGKDESEINEMMAAETWMTAQEALDAGFIDGIDKGKEKKAQVKNLFDLSVFANVPAALKEGKAAPTEREMEQALRDVGCSQRMAKAILAEGFSGNHRDDDSTEPPPTAEPQRDVEVNPMVAKDRTAELLIKAEEVAPTKRAA